MDLFSNEIISKLTTEILGHLKTIDKLKAENDTLRQFLSKEPLALQALQSAYSSYKKSSEVWADIAKDYKQALKEIKEIAEHCMKQDLCTFCDYSSKCDRSDEDEALSYDVCKLILQKISEVIDD